MSQHFIIDSSSFPNKEANIGKKPPSTQVAQNNNAILIPLSKYVCWLPTYLGRQDIPKLPDFLVRFELVFLPV
jgi:hypothetical protein